MEDQWQKNLKRFDEIVNQCPRFERKGKTMPYTSANGHMFSLLNKNAELGIRFGKERQNALIGELNSGLFHSHDAVMQGYVLIPDSLWSDAERITTLLNESYDYVMTLEPK